MRIRHKVNVRIFDDADMKDCLFGPDDALAEVNIDIFTKQTSGKFSVAAAANEDLALGDITAVKGIYLEADADFTFKLNGGSEIFQARKSTSSAKVFLEADINQVNITAAAAVLNGRYCVWGDVSA